MKTKTCLRPECGATFSKGKQRSDVEWNDRKYCSRSCAIAHANRERKVKPETCAKEGCTKPRTRNARKFCSVSCASTVRYAAQRSHLQDEVAWIVDHDHPESVARRVGYAKAEDLINKLRRTGGEELAEKLARNLDRYKRGEMSYRDEVFA